MDLEERVRILEEKVRELEDWRGTTTLVDRDVTEEQAREEIKDLLVKKVKEGEEAIYNSDIAHELHLDLDFVEDIMEQVSEESKLYIINEEHDEVE